MIRVLGGMAAVLAAATLLAGVPGMALGRARWSPWLTVLFGFNARYRVTPRDALRGVRAVDVALLLLVGATYAGFWPGPATGHAWWMTLAIAQPVLGVPLLVITKLSGRSGLMGGALVLGGLMVVDRTWPAVAWLGVASSLLLLGGDLGTTARPSRTLAGALAAGYVALVVWISLLAVLLFS
ncbi:hypothetical protein [Pedococcus sp. 2YAF34]|uniref:hypothetical protein n=1 Tax=Pedococcus sp. 2YAF34 TaxID=3233032 RepID=UPI003F98374D